MQLLVAKVRVELQRVIQSQKPEEIKKAFTYCAPEKHPDYIDAAEFDAFYAKLGEYKEIPSE